MWKTETVEWIDIELTSYFNINCTGCLRQQSDNVSSILNKEYLKISDIKKWLNKKDFPSIKIINFCGSIDEPTSHPEFFEVLEYFKTWNCHINIATNGSIRTENWWKKLALLLRDCSHNIHFGIDGLNGLSEKYRVNSNYDKVKKNFRSFISNGGKAIWQFIVFDWNEHQIEDAYNFSVDEGFIGFRKIYSHRKTSGEKKIDRYESEEIECKYAKQKRIFINHLGNVIPCCHLNSETLEILAAEKIKTNYGELFLKHGKQLETNLKYQKINEVIEGQFFEDIIKSWSTKNPIKKCHTTCKKKNYDLFDDTKIINN